MNCFLCCDSKPAATSVSFQERMERTATNVFLFAVALIVSVALLQNNPAISEMFYTISSCAAGISFVTLLLINYNRHLIHQKQSAQTTK